VIVYFQRIEISKWQQFSDVKIDFHDRLPCESPAALSNPQMEVLAPICRAIHAKRPVAIHCHSMSSGSPNGHRAARIGGYGSAIIRCGKRKARAGVSSSGREKK
jgi:hypothetical protein